VTPTIVALEIHPNDYKHRAHRKQDVAAVTWTIQRVVWSAEATFREMAAFTIINPYPSNVVNTVSS
jgi:hypothetical protein